MIPTIKLIPESACLMLIAGEGHVYIDKVFLNRYDLGHGNIGKKKIEYEANKLAAKNNVPKYVLDTTKMPEIMF